MPTYEYVCRACGHEFEEFQSIKAEPISTCPKCRKRKVERKIGIGGAVLFKGGGFYETDYRSESYQSGAEAEKKAGASSPAPAASTDAGAKAGAAAGTGSTAGPDAKPASSADTRSAAERGKETAPADSGATGDSSSASRAEKERIDARATHPSRVGRGIGNVVGRGNVKVPAPKAARAAKSTAATGRSKAVRSPKAGRKGGR